MWVRIRDYAKRIKTKPGQQQKNGMLGINGGEVGQGQLGKIRIGLNHLVL